MSFADIVILIIVITIVFLIVYRMFKKKDESICANCAYAKGCNDDCSPKKKGAVTK
ncbi:MAG: FeoB-associated Cys-rich membrane protein [Firmicutes bacterium]|nr:FeoB-associated Cys-rich membrane protein [Bacillota bacterium]